MPIEALLETHSTLQSEGIVVPSENYWSQIDIWEEKTTRSKLPLREMKPAVIDEAGTVLIPPLIVSPKSRTEVDCLVPFKLIFFK